MCHICESPYLAGVPDLPADLMALVDEPAMNKVEKSAGLGIPTRDQRRRLDRAVERIKRRIRLERELFEQEWGPIEVEPPPAF